MRSCLMLYLLGKIYICPDSQIQWYFITVKGGTNHPCVHLSRKTILQVFFGKRAEKALYKGPKS